MTDSWDVVELLAEIADVGRDAARGGYSRHVFEPAELELRAWFTRRAQALGLVVEPDRNGNLWACWGEPGPSTVATGSHLDSVPGGGALDGPLGVASALSAVARLKARGFAPARPIAVVAFAEEEGSRFGIACLGSKLMTGAVAPAAIAARPDAGRRDVRPGRRRSRGGPAGDRAGRRSPGLARLLHRTPRRAGPCARRPRRARRGRVGDPGARALAAGRSPARATMPAPPRWRGAATPSWRRPPQCSPPAASPPPATTRRPASTPARPLAAVPVPGGHQRHRLAGRRLARRARRHGRGVPGR